MARDYKNSKRSSSGSRLSGWTGFVVGLALGLSVAVGLHLYDQRHPPRGRTQAAAAPMTHDEHAADEKPAPASQTADRQYDFYEMLPKYEVVIPEKDKDPRPNNQAGSVNKPGAYVLQAGSFRNHADADRVKALLALQGVESKIEKVSVDKDTWHRVRVGPISNLDKLEETRSKLRQAQIDALVIRVGD